MNHHFNEEARSEYLDVIDIYLDVSEEVAQRFVTRFDETLSRILEDSESYAFIAPEVRSLRIPKFPYTIIYIIREMEVEIVAVAHAKRRQGYWRHRMPN